ncbi:ABC transporter permease [Acinetobacter larvae]
MGLNAKKSGKVTAWLEQLRQYAIYCLLPVTLFMLWWIAAHNAWMPVQILPSPEITWQTFKDLSANDLWWQLGRSLKLFVTGLSLGICGGIILGSLLGYSRTVEQYFSATFYALAIIPTLAWLPLFMIWLGIEDALKIFIIFKATLIPIAIHTQAGVRDIPPKLKETAAILRLSPQMTFLKLLLPASLSYFFTGLRLAMAAGWTSLIAVELLASSEGIGYLMVTGRQLFQLDIVFVSIFMIGLVGIFSDLLLQSLERRFVFWPHAALTAHAVERKSKAQVYKAWLIPVVLVVFWFLSTAQQWLSADILPTPFAVGQALFAGITDGTLLSAMYYSLYHALLGLALGSVVGIITGIVLGLFKPLQDIFAPTLNTLRLIAIFAWIPLLTAWFGLGDASKIIFIALATFFPMFIASWKGMLNVPQQLNEAADILKLSIWQKVKILILPSINPAIFAGLRLALLYSWLASFGAEYLMGSGNGIGSYMMAAQQYFEMDRVIAATLLVTILGAILTWLGKITENRATTWRRHKG